MAKTKTKNDNPVNHRQHEDHAGDDAAVQDDDGGGGRSTTATKTTTPTHPLQRDLRFVAL
jgi:hypothetical protein